MTTATVQQTPTRDKDGCPSWATDQEIHTGEAAKTVSAKFGVLTLWSTGYRSSDGWAFDEPRVELPELSDEARCLPVHEVPSLIADLEAALAAVAGSGRTVKRRADATAHLTELDG